MRRTLLLGLALILILASCSPADDAGEETTTSQSDTTSTEGDSSETTEPAAQTTTSAEETTTTAATGAGGSSCIEGQWSFGSENFVDVMTSMMTETDMAGAEVQATDGTYMITFNPDGSYMGERVDWGFAIETGDGTIVVRVNGTEEGTWSADASTITVSLDSNDMSVSATVEADGQSFELPTSPVEVPEAIAESSTYECDPSTLTVNTDEFTFTLDRA